LSDVEPASSQPHPLAHCRLRYPPSETHDT
jgi:hypothetical protein